MLLTLNPASIPKYVQGSIGINKLNGWLCRPNTTKMNKAGVLIVLYISGYIRR